jgi:hypothetical protein
MLVTTQEPGSGNQATRAGKIAAVVIVAIWLLTAALVAWLILRAKD